MNPVPIEMHRERTLADASGRIYGVVVGVVTGNKETDSKDSLKAGRVKVRFPWMASDAESAWARVATLMAGKERGSFFLPEVDDEVLVAFEHGDLSHPYVLGALWNGKDKPPVTNDDGKNNQRLIKSRSGLSILLDDTSGSEKIEIADKDGNNKLVVEMAKKKITLTSNGDIDITASQGTLTIKAKTLELSSTGETNVKATGTLNLQGQTANLKGQPTVNIN